MTPPEIVTGPCLARPVPSHLTTFWTSAREEWHPYAIAPRSLDLFRLLYVWVGPLLLDGLIHDVWQTRTRPAPHAWIAIPRSPKAADMPRKRETFREAHTRIKSELAALGWKIHDRGPNGQPLVCSYATLYHDRMGPSIRLWFRPQAIYWHEGCNHSHGNARSLVTDPRGVSAEILVALLRRFGAKP